MSDQIFTLTWAVPSSLRACRSLTYDRLFVSDFRIKISASSPLARPGWTTTFKVQLLGNSNSDSSLRFVYTLSLNGTSYLRKWSRYRAKFTYKWLEDTPAGLCEVQLAVLYLDKKDEVTLVAKKSTQILATRRLNMV